MKIEYRDGKAHVTLTWGEVMQASAVGCARRVNGMRKGWKDYFEPSGTGLGRWDMEIESCCAEMAVAGVLDRYWHAYYADKGQAPADAGGGYFEVRWTKHHPGHLCVRKNDPDNHRYYHVTGRAPRYTIHGSATGFQAKETLGAWTEEIKGRRLPLPCYFVHPDKLEPVDANDREGAW